MTYIGKKSIKGDICICIADLICSTPETGASQVLLVVKNPPANAGDIKDAGLIPGSGRSPGRGHGNPL